MDGRMRISLFVIVLAACTQRNPERCNDGLCVDPSRPYCDADGSIAGEPDRCIAVDCAPGTTDACRGDVAIVCDEAGSNYHEVECPLGCIPEQGCRECETDPQCPAMTPVCDVGICRGCAADDECDSRVCDLDIGACVPESGIVYAAPDIPMGVGTCSKTQPCSLATAITSALNGALTPVVRMLPGSYDDVIEVRFSTPSSLQIVATGAMLSVLGDVPAIAITNGGKVAVRDLQSTSNQHFQCGDMAAPNAPISFLSLDRSTLLSLGSSPRGVITRCSVRITRSTFSVGSAVSFGLIGPNPTLEMDRVHMFGNGPNNINVVNATAATLKVTNSLLEKIQVSHNLSQDTGPPGTIFLFAYDTLIDSSARLCSGADLPFRTITFENSIISGLGSSDVVDPITSGDCSFANVLVYPYSQTPPAGTIIEEPRFSNVSLGDFHLQTSSPAIDRGVPASVPATEDLEGRKRPLGPAVDLGAYEREP